MAIIPDVESQPKNRKFELEQVSIRMVRERPLYSETPIHSPEDAIRVMADALNVSLRTYEAMEEGNVEITIPNLVILENCFAINSRFIITGRETPN